MKNIIKNLFATETKEEILEKHEVVFSKTTEQEIRDYHMVTVMIKEMIDYDKVRLHESEVIWDEEKITYVFECTNEEYEKIRGMLLRMKCIEQIRLRAEWK